MTITNRALFAGSVALFASAAHPQSFSPHFETTGRGAFDQYNDTLLCNTVLESAVAAASESAQRAHLERGVNYTRNFARFLLESGNIVDTDGHVLAPDALSGDLLQVQAKWQTMVQTLEAAGDMPDAEDAEINRCLSLFGHDWD